ncbi:FHA domain-containing protein, partial [Streptomyces sp. ms191]|uniref:FHA domain-containing protein n=1 Tax=Streptomyces sp. ms191 TaxID=1827978 RepID=UPI0011CE9E84
MGERPFAPAAPELVLEIDGDATLMSPGHVYRIGRDPTSDIVLADARTSWHHAVLHVEGDHWALEDEHSTNGTYADSQRVRDDYAVGPGSIIRFGHPWDGPCARHGSPIPPGPRPMRTVRVGSGRTEVGCRKVPVAPGWDT